MSRKEMVEILTKNGIKASLKDSTVRLEKKMEKCKTLVGFKVSKGITDRRVRKVFKRISRRISKSGRPSVSRWMEEILSATSPFDAAVKYVEKKLLTNYF